jgi:hypothetical protein
MTEQSRKQVNYIVACINAFSQKHSLDPRNSFLYLQKYKGIDFLQENYEIEHTLSLDNAVDDLEIICQKNGGGLA